MAITFVHLSDIHFGQEKGADLIIKNDVKERLLENAENEIKKHAGGKATGVIVSGDIAYGGKAEEYKEAGKWLDQLTRAVGCAPTDVQVVPGNHDIDWAGISSGCKLMLAEITQHGDKKLDEFLEKEIDRESLYGRFSAYRPFAEGYNCPLDMAGGIASTRQYELAPGKTLRVIGLNSALICAEKDTKGRLLLGARQHVLPTRKDEELMVICHHPLHWLQDSDEAARYIRNRARVFVSGHEHNPALRIEKIEEGRDVMMLAAGATVPPKVENGYTYTYNLLTFDWDQPTDGLKVTIVPKAWSEEKKDFIDDDHRLGESQPTFVLGCPNFRGVGNLETTDANTQIKVNPVESETARTAETAGSEMSEKFPLVLLRFFRDLTPVQRLEVLVKLRVLPDTWKDPLTHAIERRAVDKLFSTGRLDELETVVKEVQKSVPSNEGGNG